MEFIELAEGTRTSVGPLNVTPYEVVHACGVTPYALRVEFDGRTIVYSGDTEWTERLVPAVAGADLFIAEAYFYDRVVRLHLDYTTLMRHRSDLDCKRLIIKNMGPDMLGHVGESLVEAAYDGLEVTV